MMANEAQAILSLAAAQSPAHVIIRESYLYRSVETESQSVFDNASSWR